MEQRHKDDSAAHATAQSPTFVARQQPTRDPDISTRLNVPGASQHTTTTEANGAALSQSFARDDSVAEPMRDAVDVSPRARQEGSPPAKEQGATEAAATLERLRAQNRRHQANHRSRVKRKIEETENNISHVQQRLNSAKQRCNELRNVRENLQTTIQNQARLHPTLQGAPSYPLSSEKYPLHALAIASFNAVANPTALAFRIPQQVAGVISSLTAAGALPQSILQLPCRSSSGDTVLDMHCAHAYQATATGNVTSNPFAQSSSSGSGSGGNRTGSLLQHGLRHPANSAAVLATTSPVPGSFLDPLISSITLPRGSTPTTAGSGSANPPFPTYTRNPLSLSDQQPSAAAASASASLLEQISKHAMDNPLHVKAPSISAGRPRSLWSSVQTPAHSSQVHSLRELQQCPPSPLSAPVTTNTISTAPFTQNEVSEVLSHYRTASEPGAVVSSTAGAASRPNLSSVYPAPASSWLHANPLLQGTSNSTLDFARMHASPSIMPTGSGIGAGMWGLMPQMQGVQGQQGMQQQQQAQQTLPPEQQQIAEQLQQNENLPHFCAGMETTPPSTPTMPQWNRQHDHSF